MTIFAFTAVDTLELLLVVGLVEGLGEGFGMTTLIALLSDIAPPSIRGGAIGLYRTFMDIGGFTGPILFMLLYRSYGALSAFYVGSALNLLNILLMATFRTRSESQQQ